MLTVSIHIFTRRSLICHTERDVVVEENFRRLAVSPMKIIRPHAVIERADTAPCYNIVMEFFVNILFRDEVAVSIDPAGFGRILPRDKPHIPCQFQHTFSTQVNSTVRCNAQFGITAGTSGTPCTQFADGNNNYLIFRAGSHGIPFAHSDLRLLRCMEGGKGLDFRSIFTGVF